MERERNKSDIELAIDYSVRLDQQAALPAYSDVFAMQQLNRISELGIRNEYKVNGVWISGAPSKKPEETRLVIEQSRTAVNIYNAWQAISEAKVDKPVFPEAVFRRIAGPVVTEMVSFWFGGGPVWWMKEWSYNVSLKLFVPWGVRPQGNFGAPERLVLKRIKDLEDKLRMNSVWTNVCIMPADLYATEVNRQVSPEKAVEYFARVTEAAEVRKFSVKPWSQIREENRDRYQKRSAELTEDTIREILPSSIIGEALGAARRRSGYYFESDIKAAAFRYLRERICEAEIVEDTMKPIKLSGVTKKKDNFVDRNLPRIYVIPPELQFPWLK